MANDQMSLVLPSRGFGLMDGVFKISSMPLTDRLTNLQTWAGGWRTEPIHGRH